MYWFILFSLTVFPCFVVAEDKTMAFPAVDNNVAYSNVAELGFIPADNNVSYGENALQYALFWRGQTNNTNQAQKLIVLVHGGCWLSAYDIQHTYALSTALAQAGFNVWSLEYRRTGDPGGGWPNTYLDIKAGVAAATVFNNGEFSFNNMVVIGHSAGGHLALLAGSEMPKLKAVIGLAAITDIVAYAKGANSCQRVTQDFMQGMPLDRPIEYARANPKEQVLHTNTILLQGTKDTIVPAENIQHLQRKVVLLDGVGHFDWIHPGSHAFQTLVEQLHGVIQ